MAFASIIVNGLLVLITTKTLNGTFGFPFDKSLRYPLYRDLIIIVVTEHIIVIIQFIIQLAIDDVPGWV